MIAEQAAQLARLDEEEADRLDAEAAAAAADARAGPAAGGDAGLDANQLSLSTMLAVTLSEERAGACVCNHSNPMLLETRRQRTVQAYILQETRWQRAVAIAVPTPTTLLT